MKRTEITEIYNSPESFKEKALFVCGWAKTLRMQKSIGFIDINDGSCFYGLQIVADGGLPNYEELQRLNVGSALRISGRLVFTPGAKQPFELHAQSIEIEGTSTPDYPLQKKRHTPEYLREIAHLRPRTNLLSSVFRIRSCVSKAIHDFFDNNGFLYVHTPIITASDCEGAGEMFRVTTLDISNPPKGESGEIDYCKDFFSKPANLTVSGQLEGEAFAHAFGKIYTFGPTFRAEKSNTPRHAAEFWMVEPEMAFADLEEDMKTAEAMIKYIVRRVFERCRGDIEFLNRFVDESLISRLEMLINSEFGRVTYTEAVERLLQAEEDIFEYPVGWGLDLQTEHERYLTEKIYKKPVFVTDYPKEIKAFYMRLNDDGKTVAAMDLLVPGVGEIIGGSQREERLEILQSRMSELGLPEKDYWWYLNLRRFGGTKHAGFGLGLERLVMYITGVQNIRDVLPFPRTLGSADF